MATSAAVSRSLELATGTPRFAIAQLAPSRPVSCTPKSKMSASVTGRGPTGRSSCWALIRSARTSLPFMPPPRATMGRLRDRSDKNLLSVEGIRDTIGRRAPSLRL